MGTRALGDRPWLVSDEHRRDELALKAQLLDAQRDSVIALTDDSRDASLVLLDLVEQNGNGSDHPPATDHPLEHAALSAQEDLCLLQRRPDGWHLDASVLCFPTRWRLHEKVGHHIAEVHGPVEGYDPLIVTKVDRLFDQLTERPVWRRNWFLMTDPTLYQPDRPEHETIIDRSDVRSDLYIRSERQTLRRLDEGWIVFTIRIQQKPLGELLTTNDRTHQFAHWVEHVSSNFGLRRHLTEAQRTELVAGLADRF